MKNEKKINKRKRRTRKLLENYCTVIVRTIKVLHNYNKHMSNSVAIVGINHMTVPKMSTEQIFQLMGSSRFLPVRVFFRRENRWTCVSLYIRI